MKEELTAEEVVAEVRSGYEDFRGRTIKGETTLSNQIINGNLLFQGAVFTGSVHLNCAVIKGILDFENAVFEQKIKDPTSSGTFLDMTNIQVTGCIILAFEKPPAKIYVSLEIAELVHWAAPTVPLVVVQRAK